MKISPSGGLPEEVAYVYTVHTRKILCHRPYQLSFTTTEEDSSQGIWKATIGCFVYWQIVAGASLSPWHIVLPRRILTLPDMMMRGLLSCGWQRTRPTLERTRSRARSGAIVEAASGPRGERKKRR